jgi:dynein heavy chain
MLIGLGGSGKQTLSKLGTFCLGMSTFTVQIVAGRQKTEAAIKKYLIDSFREKMQELLEKTGVKCKGITFLVTDTTIVEETYLEDINNLLNSGEIPNLFAEEDK